SHFAGVIIGVAKFVVNLFRVRSEFERVLVRTDRLRAFSLLNFAVTNLYPGVRAFGISVCSSFEIADSVVVVSQPKRIQASSIGRLSEVAQPFFARNA